jgi:membrane peptidoglycan carboxypeptidase
MEAAVADTGTAGASGGRRGLRAWRVLARTVGASVLVLAAGAILMWVATPSVNDLEALVRQEATGHGATILTARDIPSLLAQAVVATEDERFYQHHGIDVIGLGRALLYDVSHLCACQGGSTITQQLVKDLYLGGSDTGFNKLVDMTLALKVEIHLTKQQILADYLSVVLTGYGRWGMASAACADYHRPLADLDLGQLALLAGLPQAPSAFDPLLHPAAALARRSEVLAAMVEDSYISPPQAATAAAEAPTLPAAPGGC